MFAEVHNRTEAHKDPQINLQINAIEAISIETSSRLIQEYAYLPSSLSISTVIVSQALSKKTSELLSH